ncbi:MAG: dipicolinate synthase subunit B [Clostridia bacterium]
MSKKLGFAISGSFCTFQNILVAMSELVQAGYELIPIFSYIVAETDTRFFKAKDFRSEVRHITGREPIDSIVDAEPLGTRDKLDLMVVAPCTGNTLSKIAHGITDTPITMAVKAHLRNNRPVLISLSSNDALGANAKNLGTLLNTKNIFFVPFGQDNPEVKTRSLIADTVQILPAIEAAMEGRQLQPLFCRL